MDEHRDMDEHALALFEGALDDTGLSKNRELRETLVSCFRWATTLMNAHQHSADSVHAGLPMARWSWDGLVTGTR